MKHVSIPFLSGGRHDEMIRLSPHACDISAGEPAWWLAVFLFGYVLGIAGGLFFGWWATKTLNDIMRASRSREPELQPPSEQPRSLD